MGLRAGKMGLIQREKVVGKDVTVVFGHTQLRIVCVERRSQGKLDMGGGWGGGKQELNILCLARRQWVGVSECGRFL